MKATKEEEEVKQVISQTKPVDHLALEHDESKRTLARNISAATFAESDAHGEFILNSKVCDTATKETEKAIEPEKSEVNEVAELKQKEKKQEELYPTESEVASAEKQQKASKVSIKLRKPNQHIIKKKRQVSSIEDTKRDQSKTGTNYG